MGQALETWVLEAVESLGRGKSGATLRSIQRYIDEKYYEELAVDTLEVTLASLITKGKVSEAKGHYLPTQKTSKEDALKKLFGDS